MGADRLGGELQAVEHQVRASQSRVASLSLAGSDSAPLAITAGVLRRWSAASSTARELAVHGEGGAAAAGQAGRSTSLISAPGRSR